VFHAALSGIATDVEVSIHEIQSLLDEEDKQEKEFQVNMHYLFAICFVISSVLMRLSVLSATFYTVC